MLRLLIPEPEVRKAFADKEHYLWGRVAREIEGNYLALVAGSSVPKPAPAATATGYRPRAA